MNYPPNRRLQNLLSVSGRPCLPPEPRCISGHSILSLPGYTQNATFTELKVEKKVKSTFGEVQLRSILNFKAKTFTEHRTHSLLCLLFETGIRIEEALTLKTSSVDFDNLLITVRGKGNKERKVPFGFELRKVLFKFIRRHNEKFPFPVRGGGHLEYHNARRDFKDLMERLGIQVAGSFHNCRRAFKNYLRRKVIYCI